MNENGAGVMLRRLALIFGIAMALGSGGCGIKGPPMPPQKEPIPAVTNLSASIAQEAIVLTWSAAGNPSDVAGYTIYSSRSDLTQPPCQGCPREFMKVGTYSMDGQGESGEMYQFSFLAAPGFRYLIKVRPYVTGGAHGPESNTVMIEFQK